MDLVTVAGGRGRAVVADGDGQEMELEIGVGHRIVAPDEAAGLEVVAGPDAGAAEKPFEPDGRLIVPLERREKAHGLAAGILDIDLQMVL